MTHPYIHLLGQSSEQPTGNIQYLETSITKFTIGRGDNRASELSRKDLKAIADSKLRTVNRIQKFFVRLGSSFVINGRWPTRKNQPFWRTGIDCFNRSIERQDLTIHSCLA